MMEPGQKAHEVFKREWGCEPGWGNLSARYKAAWAAVEAACVPAVPADVEGLVESLKKPVYSDDLMIRWDCWRKRHKEGFGGSATRDEFESIIDWIDEERAAAAFALQAQAAEIERLRAQVAEFRTVNDGNMQVSEMFRHQRDAAEDKLREAVEVILDVNDAAQIDVRMEGPRLMGWNRSELDRAWPKLRAFLATMEKTDG